MTHARTHTHMHVRAHTHTHTHAQGGRRAEHMKFGLVLGEDGKRIRSRDGGTISLSSLLDEARDRTIKALKERAASGEGRVAAKDLKTVAGKVGCV